MRLTSLGAAPLTIPLTTRFKHASAERSETSTVLVTASAASGITGTGEGCPRPYVTGETVDSTLAFVEQHRAAITASVVDLASLRAWAAATAPALDANPAAWCAVELAILDLLGSACARPLEHVIGLPTLSGPFVYTAVIGDGDQAHFAQQWARYLAAGFHDVKLKISGDLHRDAPKLEALAGAPGIRVRVDANNLFRSAADAVTYLRAVPASLCAVEEPLPAGDIDGMRRVFDAVGIPIVLDESVTTAAQVAALPEASGQWIVNVRVSKMGGVLRALDVVAAARRHRHRVVVGAQVGETSLLTRAALPVAEAAGPALMAMEGAFGTLLLARDLCDPALMFGAGGRLRVEDHPRLTLPGLGVT